MPAIQMAYSDSISVCTVRIVRFTGDKEPCILVKHIVRIISMVITARRYLRNSRVLTGLSRVEKRRKYNRAFKTEVLSIRLKCAEQ